MNTTERRGRAAGTANAMLPHAEAAAGLLRALANEQRLMVLCNLADGEASVGTLNDRVPLSQSALSQHLAVLRDSGIVSTRRDAQVVYYSLAPGPAAQVIATLHDIFCAPSAGRTPKPRRTAAS
ncbi:MAG TPA: metalloregulator ArsR/SmtB family transcription factor [Steroidobacteraceae bacterium]|nr:metalloregulator ArsR/SmtB family transcription factor [Steroidobacteraceae bacterium]